nr:LOW QUALITY PROTEIN: uncharacterized protein LOC121124116 [Lepeophtheirus salmonis]
MGYPENKHAPVRKNSSFICGTLCICMAVSVLSSVALVYLTVIIYLPSSRELSSGIGEQNVMCTTVEKKKIVDDVLACKWSSCGEWCLSKGGGACTHLYVSVRSNGTDMELKGCKDLVDKTCASLDMSKISTNNCKEDHQCTKLDKLFRCTDGLCYNISQVYTCHWRPEDVERYPPYVDCIKKRNCIELEGNYECNQGRCTQIKHWSCERRCNQFPSKDSNNIIVASDRILFANCEEAINTRTGQIIWKKENHPGKTLISSCTNLSPQSDMMHAKDCINGSLIDSKSLEGGSKLHHSDVFFLINMPTHKLDGNGEEIPFEKDIIIFEKSRLMINTDGCVNTLKGECNEFYKVHGQDGRNSTSPSRFPCYYAPSNPDYVVVKYDLNKTKWLFLLFFVVPSCLLIISCSVLFICSRVLTVDNSGQMNMECCLPNTDSVGDVQESEEYNSNATT